MDQGVFNFPISCDASGNVFEHESVLLNGSENLGTSKPF